MKSELQPDPTRELRTREPQYQRTRRVLEVVCADAFGTRLVQQEVGEVTAADFAPAFVDDVLRRMDPN